MIRFENAREMDCGCSFDKSFITAIETHQLDVFKWLVNQGYPYNKEDCLRAAYTNPHNDNFKEIIECIQSLPRSPQKIE